MARPTVQSMAQEILATSAALFVTSGDPFARVELTPGPPVGDCASDRLTVHGALANQAALDNQPTARAQHRGGARPTFQYGITTFRCVQPFTVNNAVPPTATVNAEGLRHLTDLDVLWYGLTAAIDAGTLIDGLGCSAIQLNNALPLQPDSLAGWRVTLTVTP